MTLEQAIEHAANTIPEEWTIRLEVLGGRAYVEVVRPDGSEVGMDDAENDLEEQVVCAILMIRDELAAEKLREANAKGDATLPANGQPESKNEQQRG